MDKLNFSIKINAPRERVWSVLLNDETYRKWTAEFAPGSHAVTDWQEGSKTLFLDGNGNGMFSTIVRNVPNELISIKHLGIMKYGKEVPEDSEALQWAGAEETYMLRETGNITELKVSMDTAEKYKDYFSKTWPKALEKVKELSE